MALPSEGFSAAQHGPQLLHLVALRRRAHRIHHALYIECREQAEREGSPTACIIDSQSVKSAKKGGAASIRTASMGKLIKGKKRHILVDTLGLLLHAIVHSAGIQDRDGGIVLLATLFGQFPFLAKLFADSAYQGPIFGNALAKILPCLETEIVKRPDQAKGFVVARALDRRTHDRLAQPLPPPRQGLGKSQPQRPRVLETRIHPPNAAKALQSMTKFGRNFYRIEQPAFGQVRAANELRKHV